MEATYSQTRSGIGPTTQGVRHNIELGNGKTLQIRSGGRSHCLSVTPLSALLEGTNQATNAILSSHRVEGTTPHECIDAIVVIGDQRFHVQGAGRSHYVALEVVRSS